MKDKKEAIQGLMKVFRIVTKIGFVACIVGASICGIGLICALIWGDNPQVVQMFIDYGLNVDKSTMICFCLCGFIETLAFVYLMLISTRMFKHELELGTPFDEKLAKEVQRVGVIYALLSMVVSFACAIILELFKLNMDLSNGTSIMLGLAYFVVGCILEYGCALIKKGKEPAEETVAPENSSGVSQEQPQVLDTSVENETEKTKPETTETSSQQETKESE